MKYVTKRAEASDAKTSSPNDELHQLVENLALQPRLEQFAEATGLSVLLRSWPDGPRVLEVGGAASPLLQDDDETLDLTVGSGAPDEVGERGHALRRCRHQLLHGHAKIVFEGGPIGTLSLGGVLTESPDLALAADRAKALGIDEGAYLAAIAATPIFTEDRLRACLLFASEVVTDLAAKRAENLRTKREAERLGRTLSELRKVQERLSESQG